MVVNVEKKTTTTKFFYLFLNLIYYIWFGLHKLYDDELYFEIEREKKMKLIDY